jgi:hypothetical protein
LKSEHHRPHAMSWEVNAFLFVLWKCHIDWRKITVTKPSKLMLIIYLKRKKIVWSKKINSI